jgi:acid phosphatase
MLRGLGNDIVKTPSQPCSPRLLRFLLAALFMVLLQGCSILQARVDTHESLNATLWTQSSAEYAANALQTYRLAASNLDRALEDKRWTAALEQGDGYIDLPPAIVLDLDQTVLDTSPYNARIVLERGSYASQHFADWCRESAAPPVPGVKRFVEHALERGVAIFYISARHESWRGCTSSNLRALGLPLPEQERLLLNDGTPSTRKTRQRAKAASRYRLLLLLGDDLNDFVSGSKSDPDTRRALVYEHAGRWGREWIILPNPMYGNWKASVYGFDSSLPRDERLKRLLQQLER